MRLSSCTASVGTLSITGAKARGSFLGSPISCAGGWIGPTGAPAALEVSWSGSFDGNKSRFDESSVRDGNTTGSFAGLAQLSFDLPPPGPSPLCDHRSGLRRTTLTGTITLGSPPPAFGPAKTVVNGGYGEYCAILTTDGVVCWGGNADGELGNGAISGPDDCEESCSITPVSVGISATSLASDSGTWCAILTSGGVDCWGGNDNGDLGVGSTHGPAICSSGYPCSTRPLPIGISATSLVGSWTGNFCAILTSGRVDCWGNNVFGQLGIGTTDGPETCDGSPCSTTPVSVGISATSLASDSGGYCAILTSGGVDCWGANDDGDLGIGTTVGPDSCPGNGSQPVPCSTSPVSTGISVTSLMGAPGNYCAILTSGGVDCWGSNPYGELGDGSSTGPDSCDYGEACSTTPAPVGISATRVVSRGSSTCAILTSGGVDCWGAGALGNGTSGGPDACYQGAVPCSTTPVSVGISATSLSTSGSSYCAILTSGPVDCWGSNYNGELGIGRADGPETCGAVPYALPCSTTPASTGVSAVSVDSDGESYCAILTSGAADCWGDNFNGELGDNTTMNSDVPVPVIGIGP